MEDLGGNERIEIEEERIQEAIQPILDILLMFVVKHPWLSNFPDIEKRVKRPAVALISTDATWITFMKLRLDHVLKGAFEANSVKDALSGNPDAELNFKKPEKWVAPYSKYEGPWWSPFLPPKSE
ncbi:hypothetical protein R1flu_020431 [Riccia fluitans]|uniref:Uncharacterized protein n=1 Tax=Riccia fluitans TaxID=41844 RepID=A0ABD1ZLI4_9MARC